MKSTITLCLLCLAASGIAGAQSDALEQVVVTASLRHEALQQLAASATVLDADTLQSAGVQHLQEVLPLVPNLNWAMGSSRPRYFQIRGVGETEQWQGAPNPSVGFLIDGMDFSGIGMPATLFDVSQVEVLRGPQAAAYGANSLAGLINVRTREPSLAADWRAEVGAGDHDSHGAAVLFGGALAGSDALAYRLVAQQYRGDGFRSNAFLGRDDTNGYDETAVRGKLRFDRGERLRVDVATLWVDQDNGYDAFSIDNSRTTLSDKPGRDAQRSRGASLSADYEFPQGLDLGSVTAWSDARIRYSFDGDWGFDPAYDFTSRFERRHRALSQDLRLMSRSGGAQGSGAIDWLVGAYALQIRESNDQLDLYNGEIYTALVSDYRATSVSLYGQLAARLASHWTLTTALRAEQREADYSDSAGSDFAPRDRMWGGHLSLQREFGSGRQSYLMLSRGYKAGGFNIGAQIPAPRRSFAPEILGSAEWGVKGQSSGARARWQTALFYMRRSSQQVPGSEQLVAGDPLSFVYYTDNAARGENYGLEFSGAWRASPRWNLSASSGLLRTRFLGYRVGERDLAGRAQAHAPGYQFALAAEYQHPQGWYGRLDWVGRDGFYFSESHDQRAPASAQLNLRLGLARDGWNVSLWARNLFDADVVQRGFFFGNEPPDFPDKLYVQRGDPRQVGVQIQFGSR